MPETENLTEPLLAATLNSLPDAVIAVERAGLVTFINPAAEALLGWKRAEALKRKLVEVLVIEDPKARGPVPMAQFLRESPGSDAGDLLLLRRGKEIPVEVAATPIRDDRDRRLGTVLVIRDLTERRRAEAELRSALNDAVSASRTKSEILTKMSHALRTPMNGIIGMTELVLDTEISQEQRDFLEIVRSSARSLTTVINDILDLSRLDTGKLVLEASDFSLRHCLGDLLRALAMRAQEKGLDLSLRVSPEVPDGLVGDPVRLRQIVVNLVDNAIKFTERGEVAVDVSSARAVPRPENGLAAAPALNRPDSADVDLRFTVTDTGIGIRADKLDAIFEPFAQGSTSVTRKYGGTGLGLAISATLVEKMGGRIWVDSAVGQGSTFSFTARFRVSSDPAANAVPPALPKLWGLPVLVVDRHATSRGIVEEMLVQWHMKPTALESTQTALTHLEQAAAAGEPFPLVLLDGHNLDADSLILAQQLHRRPELVGATLMMLLPRSRSAAASLCREVGIAATVIKPIKQSDLLDAIVTALRISFQDGRWQSGCTVTGLLAPLRPLRVLLVEDNEVNQKLAARILEKQRHTVVSAMNGKEALALLDQQAFDLVLMDLQMPEMGGLEATVRIRERERGTARHLPIIAVTAHAMVGDREKCLAAGMDEYVAKPLRSEDLLRAMHAVILRTSPEPPQNEPHPRAPSEPVIDRAAVLERMGNDFELLAEVVDLFLEDCPRLLTSIRDAVKNGDTDQLRKTAHSLKGSIGNFSAAKAFDAATKLETIAEAGDLAGAEEVIAALESEIHRLELALAELTVPAGTS